MYDYIYYDSPLGRLTIAAEGDAVTVLVLGGQKYEEQHLNGEGRELKSPALAKALDWLDRYFAGKLPEISELVLEPTGTNFQKRVWSELTHIAYGETDSYGAIASRLGSSPRAVGSAVGRNPISIIIPCHRVLSSDGRLTGYAGGLDNKIKLLRHEGVLI